MIRGIRNVRSEFNLHGTGDLTINLTTPNPDSLNIIELEKSFIINSTKIQDILFEETPSNKISKSIKFLVSDLIVSISLSGLVDMEKELDRLKKELFEVYSNIERLNKLLQSENFINKAPEEVVESEQERLELSKERKLQLEEIIESIA